MLRLRLAQDLQLDAAVARAAHERRGQAGRARVQRQRPPPRQRLRQLAAILPAQLPAQLAAGDLAARQLAAGELVGDLAAALLAARPVRRLQEPLAWRLEDGWTR